MSFRLKSKRKIVGKTVILDCDTGSAAKITKTSVIIDLENRAVKEIENLAKRQSETRVYKSPSLTVNNDKLRTILRLIMKIIEKK